MKQSIIPIVCALFFSTPALAGISNIRRMSQNSNGYFNVTCLNGSTETVDAQAIAKNLVCNPGVQSFPGASQFCKNTGMRSLIASLQE